MRTHKMPHFVRIRIFNLVPTKIENKLRSVPSMWTNCNAKCDMCYLCMNICINVWILVRFMKIIIIFLQGVLNFGVWLFANTIWASLKVNIKHSNNFKFTFWCRYVSVVPWWISSCLHCALIFRIQCENAATSFFGAIKTTITLFTQLAVCVCVFFLSSPSTGMMNIFSFGE